MHRNTRIRRRGRVRITRKGKENKEEEGRDKALIHLKKVMNFHKARSIFHFKN